MNTWLRIGYESFIQAWNELKSNKLRTFLSLLGVTIGIFCVISVATLIDSLQNNIQSSVNKLGSNTLYLEKWPWTEEGDYAWWDYVRRPNPTANEAKLLQKELSSASAVGYMAGFSGQLKHRDISIKNMYCVLVNEDIHKAWNFEMQEGRYFSLSELQQGSYNIILGYSVYEQLFPNGQSAEGKEVSFNGNKLNVIGVLKKEGKNLLDISFDSNVIIPYQLGKNFTAIQSDNDMGQQMLLACKPGISMETFKEEVRGQMRNIRNLKPKEKDNFSINELSMLSGAISSIFGIVNKAGLFIGIFALLVGGFGIANIMFVSVKERTNLIGIKKALGARPAYILIEFLIEAILLCIIGGIVGMTLVFLLSQAISHFANFSVSLSMSNFVKGITISTIIGLLAGLLPAMSASGLDPVEAIRSK